MLFFYMARQEPEKSLLRNIWQKRCSANRLQKQEMRVENAWPVAG